jgi:hypothetical protein
MDLGYQDTHPALEMISPSISFVDVITAEKRQVVIESLSAQSTKWDGLTGGKFGKQCLQKKCSRPHRPTQNQPFG